jgi:hypothetical protein
MHIGDPAQQSRRGRAALALAAVVAGFALLLVAVGIANALTGSNVVPPSKVGLFTRSAPMVSTSAPVYELDEAGTTVVSVRFDLRPAVDNQVLVKLASSGDWLTCLNEVGAISCDAHRLPVADRDTFAVKVLP